MLEVKFLEKNQDWPRSRFDFDKVYPTRDLVLRSENPRRATWTTSWATNALGLIFTILGLVVLSVVWPMRNDMLQSLSEEPILVRGLVWLFAAIAVLGLLLCAMLVVFRARLVVDRELGELRVYAWGRRHDVVPFEAIRLLSFERVFKVSSGDDGPDMIPVLVMELHDSTLVRVTEGSSTHMKQLRQCLESACGGRTKSATDHAPDDTRQQPDLSSRTDWLEGDLARTMSEAFPDDPDVRWKQLSTTHVEPLTYVEAQPDSDLGYERFEFVFDGAGPMRPELIGCYCFEQNRWRLLFGTDPARRHPPEEVATR